MALSHGADGDLGAVWAPTAGAVGGPAGGGPGRRVRRPVAYNVLNIEIVFFAIVSFMSDFRAGCYAGGVLRGRGATQPN